jgi:hypothetical protein
MVILGRSFRVTIASPFKEYEYRHFRLAFLNDCRFIGILNDLVTQRGKLLPFNQVEGLKKRNIIDQP